MRRAVYATAPPRSLFRNQQHCPIHIVSPLQFSICHHSNTTKTSSNANNSSSHHHSRGGGNTNVSSNSGSRVTFTSATTTSTNTTTPINQQQGAGRGPNRNNTSTPNGNGPNLVQNGPSPHATSTNSNANNVPFPTSAATSPSASKTTDVNAPPTTTTISSTSTTLEMAVKQQREAAIALHRRTSSLELILNDHTQQLSRFESILMPLQESCKRTNVKLGQVELHMERVKQRADQCTLELSEMSRREAQQRKNIAPVNSTTTESQSPSITSTPNTEIEAAPPPMNTNNVTKEEKEQQVTVSRREWDDLTRLVHDLVAQVASLQQQQQTQQEDNITKKNATIVAGATANESVNDAPKQRQPSLQMQDGGHPPSSSTPSTTPTTTTTTATVLFDNVPLTCSAAMLRAMCMEALAPYSNKTNAIHNNNTGFNHCDWGVLSVLAGPSSPLNAGGENALSGGSGENAFAMSRRLYVTVSSLAVAQCIVQRLDGRPWQMKTSAASAVQTRGERVLLSCRIAVGSSS